jgi:amidase
VHKKGDEMIRHTFIPQRYFQTIGSHEPVCSLEPGDRVLTTTVDAHGQDEHGEQVTGGPNPMTGPFFINGAEPGDTLVLRLLKITPNRPVGWSSWGIDPGLVDPWFVPELALPDKNRTWEPALWDIDLAEGAAILRDDQNPVLQRLSLPMSPMLGCFGVAPEDAQSISTATSGPYGGNMDYRGFAAGAVVYLPVFVTGALLFLGDGHALQSDGEIAGTGVEISMDVEFEVGLVKNKTIRWPRGENESEIFTVGNARPMLQALQHATTEMLRWLKEDYSLDARSAGLLAGQVAAYEVGNVFDPAFTMVCKIKKDILAKIKR